jgi:DNA helicase-2/ATP-dependent DNA helicase PcrA
VIPITRHSSQVQPWLEGLNHEQRQAATHADGPLLIVAGAGTGKTNTVAARVSHLLGDGVPPERILLLTFTRRASEEMLRRAASAIPEGPAIAKKVWGGTFHAIANRLLRMSALPARLTSDFTIMDRTDSEDLLDIVRHDLDFSGLDRRFPRKSTCMSIYSRRVNGNEELAAVLTRDFPWCQEWDDQLNNLFREYALRKQRSNSLDYDDLLLYLYILLSDDEVSKAIGGMFDHILVDEYQDTNSLQASILLNMRRDNNNITVVGDDAQSIYGFRSATVQNMLDFPVHYPGARVVTLEQNYRSVQPILETTNRIIAQAHGGYSKELWSERKGEKLPVMVTCQDETYQDKAVIKRVLEHYEEGIPLRKQAVLFRASHHSASLEIALARKNIPYQKYGGLRFLEAAHVKDLVSILRILVNPRDEMAWFRVLQLLDGIGPATAALVYKHVASNHFDPVSIGAARVPAAVKEGVASLAQILADSVAMREAGPSAIIERVLEFYRPLLGHSYDNVAQRVSDVEQLGNLAGRYQTIAEFLADLSLDPPVSTGDLAGPPHKDEDWLVLSTIHSAKGLEWDAVYLIHAADGFLPSDMATGSDEEIEEELRLTYVATTRARDFLYVLWPLRYYHRGSSISDRHGYAQRCRFFSQEVLRTMEHTSEGEKSEPGSEIINEWAGVDVNRRILDMWK